LSNKFYPNTLDICNVKKYLCLLVLIIIPFIGFSQVNDEELAAEFLNNKEYDKAAILYEKLLKKDQSSPYYYQNLVTCFLELKSFDEAEKMIKRQAKKFPSNYFYKVDLGYLLQKQNKTNEAFEIYNTLISSIDKSPTVALQLATAFLRRDLPDLSISTYLRARKVLKSESIYSENLLDLYVITKRNRELIGECFELIKESDENLEKAKSYLYRAFENSKDIDYLKEICLTNIQKYPNRPVFDDLLIWTFVQNRDFEGAFRQSLAIDKREKGEGRRLIELAEICLANQDFETAVNCYKNVIVYGETGVYYANANYGMLDVKYQIIHLGIDDSPEFVNTTVDEFNLFLNRFGKTSGTSPYVKELADLYMFYQHDITKAINFLEEINTIPGVQPRFAAEAKLQLADAYLVSGDIWEAQLLYSQVDKDFKEDPLGQEAKFRNARLSYFNADFEWAKEQLDILKTATSQLISNDAIELSLMIQENTGLDSTTDALKEFAKADLFIFQNNLDKALEIINLFPFKFPKHDLDDDILFAKARIMEKKRDLNQAVKLYESLISLYGYDILADNALYNLARIYDYKLKDKMKAKESYEKLIFNYNSSLFSVEARKRQKILKDDLGS
jgi:tetratricopeptide (TPR) repeat protein